MQFIITIPQIAVSLCLLIVAGIAKAYMDESAEGRFTDGRANWNKVSSFMNKWLLDGRGYRVPQPKKLWYYMGLTPQYVERFPFSSTWLAFITDMWHLAQFVCFNSMYLAFSVAFFPNWLAMATCFISCKALNISFALYRRLVLKNKT